MSKNNPSVVTRFAPSPTGFMHVGGVRTALFAWLWARKNNGTFILRIEDTDKAREVSGSIEHIKKSLTWLGIDWDYGPDIPGPFGSCIQSERLPLYTEYAQRLIEKGYAYSDPYTTEEVETFRKQAQKENRPFLFREHRPDTFEAWDGTKPLRLCVPELKRYEWQDAVRGTLSAGEEMLDDIILIKSDGYPTYNFAHIVDDYEMGVTHVMRGDEFISSTPKFLSIYDALEIPYPTLVSLPPIMAADGKKKLGKRDGAKDILEYKDEGYLPEAMVNFLVLIGWNPGTDQELFIGPNGIKELITSFQLSGIQKSGGAFNEDKLKWINKEHIQTSLSPEEQEEYVLNALPDKDPDILRKLTPTILERVHNKTEIKEAADAEEYDWAFTAPHVDVDLVKWKNDKHVADAKSRLRKAIELLASSDFSSPEAIKKSLWEYAEEVGRGELLWPLRVALSGQERSPDPFVIAYILGKDETLTRIQTVCDKIGG